MFLKSLQWRLVSIFILITVSIMIFVGVFLNKSVETSYYEIFKNGIKSGFKNWDWNIGDMSNIAVNDVVVDLKDKRSALLSFSIIGEFRSYTIINSDKISSDKTGIIFSSDRVYNQDKEKFLFEALKSDNLASALKGKTGEMGTIINSDDGAYFDYAQPLRLKDGNYILYFRYYREEWLETINNFSKIIITCSIIAVLASLGLGYILSKTITVPIVGIMHKAREVAGGDFDRILEVKSNDEIGELTNTFNYMARELKNTLIEISSEKSKIETILNYMTDGVIAFNVKSEVIHANPAAMKMLGLTEISGTFSEFSEKYDLGLSLEEILYFDSPGGSEKSVNINNRFIRIYFALFTDDEKKADGIIAVLQDITEQQKLENMRKEFVANVSHELRTPLTSIKSYTETLLDGTLDDRETSEKFLNVINSEADRMTRLVKDLLQLSRRDNNQMQLDMKDIAFVDLVRNSVDKMQIEARNKDQILESFVIGAIPEIKADRDRLEQVVMNLLSNAIKYTPPGGKITVYIGKIYREAYLKVADTGIGIPEADLPRIFERFYRVDKARSRELGGTGLGLSIAKEIVEAHGGSISASSVWGKGTEITVKLPI